MFLVVGIDRREGLGAEYEGAGTERVTGARADSILLVCAQPRRNRIDVVGVPRELSVDLPCFGLQRLGSLLEFGGVSLLAEHTTALLGVPVHHYVEFDFRSFVKVIDAVGGVRVDLPDGAVDDRTGVHLQPGVHVLDGLTALALTRSRLNHRVIDGRTSTVHLGDTGRMDRLTLIVEAFVSRLSAELTAGAICRLAWAAKRHLVVDELLTGSLLADLVGGIDRWEIVYTQLTTCPLIPMAELLSPFPPHQPSGSSPLITDCSANAVLDHLRRS